MILNKRTILWFFLCCCAANLSLAQPPESDTFILSYGEYIRIVIDHHPLSRNADLQLNKGEANLLYARGAFDPKAFSRLQEKFFEEKQYYSKLHGGLKMPTWFGVELLGAYEQNEGTFLNPEENTPANGLLYAGIALNLGQGLFIDKRRMELNKAKLYREISKSERELLLNKLIFEAGNAYWQWFRAYYFLEIYRTAYQLAVERYEGVIEMARAGERPAIDTVEAAIQLQNRQYSLQEAELRYKNAGALLSVYLWEDGMIPLELSETTIPANEEIVKDEAIPAFVLAFDTMWAAHPELVKTELKIDQVELEKRWRAELLKPVVRLKYNPITEYVGPNSIRNFTFNDYTWGLELSMPLFLRKERGALQLYDVKLKQMQNSFRQTREMLKFKVSASVNRLFTLDEQILVYTDIVNNYYELLAGENELFDNGESSLFMINSREMGYVNARVKLIELIAKKKETELKIKYHLGRAHEE